MQGLVITRRRSRGVIGWALARTALLFLGLVQLPALAPTASAEVVGQTGSAIVVPEIIRLLEAREQSIPIAITSPDRLPPDSWVGLKCIGAKPNFSVGSPWHGGWRVAVADLGTLKLAAPPGTTILVIGLMTAAGDVLATTSTTLSVQPAPHPSTPPPEIKTARASPAGRLPPPAGRLPPMTHETEPRLAHRVASEAPAATRSHASIAAAARPSLDGHPMALPSFSLQPVDRGGGQSPTAPVTRVKSVIAPPAAAKPEPPVAAAGPSQSNASRWKLVELGEFHFAHGRIAEARARFEKAANAGLASAALRMGDTFAPPFDDTGVATDPSTEVPSAAPMPRPGQIDLTMARHWYARAQELGAREAAADRLGRLGAWTGASLTQMKARGSRPAW